MKKVWYVTDCTTPVQDNDLRENTWNISHVIHVVVGEWKAREQKKYLLKWFMLLFVY